MPLSLNASLKNMGSSDDANYGPLRRLVSPYMLRHLKTDKNVINDLPDKTELHTWCNLSKQQAKRYQVSVKDLAKKIETAERIEHGGLPLAFLTRLTQICNQPAHWSGAGKYTPAASGKFTRLVSLCEKMALRQEKVLVFTQHKEITVLLSTLLAEVFGSDGLALHGGTTVNQPPCLIDYKKSCPIHNESSSL